MKRQKQKNGTKKIRAEAKQQMPPRFRPVMG